MAPVTRLDLTVAGGAYDRTVALADGRVRARGINLRYLALPIEEIFWRAFRYDEFDVSELSLGYYLTLRSMGDQRYVAIPVFPSRFFRHGCVFVPSDSTRRSLQALEGATIGLPEYTMTACVWLRGLLWDECGITPSDIHWRYGGIESPGRRDRADLSAPPGVDLQPLPEGSTLNEQLAVGELDAVFSPRILSGYWKGRIRRLLPDYAEHEAEYYRRTGIFPMMHVVALRREIYDQYPWTALHLFEAYQESKRIAYEWLADINALPVSLPWFVPEWERTQEMFGPDPWVDGLEPNRPALETLRRYLLNDGVQPFELNQLFAPSVLDTFVI